MTDPKTIDRKKIKIVAFDCDGVMFETREANIAYYNRILSNLGRPDMTPEQSAHAHMHTVGEALSHLFPDPEEREAANDFRKELGYLPFLKYIRIEPYLKTLLKKLRPKFKTAVVTNRTDTMAHILELHGLEDLFDMVVTALDAPRPKPHPDPLLKMLGHFKARPDQAVYIGDSKVDEEAAGASHIPLVAYANPSLDAARHIESLKEMEGIVLGLAQK
ncbi:conserved hypothetical protein [Candidatus Desulfarcum epimagneticum]|uniref:phosphoglycolate phosphatase n=1 Tax=uncultured Desulfobacteraceae bacterium TaxID=218296 RepID=A0A484HIY9_9BACT|nr:conserved hypothetical protein [uncultured Desulfobacteraceae bacterium]